MRRPDDRGGAGGTGSTRYTMREELFSVDDDSSAQ
jgi:hypothetical protein